MPQAEDFQGKVDRLRNIFPKLSEEDQRYVIGLSEGLKFAQNALNSDGLDGRTAYRICPAEEGQT